MNAQIMLKENAARAADVAKAAGLTAGALAETLERKSELLAGALDKQSEVVVAALGSKAGPIAKAVEVKADALGEALEVTLEKARQDAERTLKEFKFGRREGLILGVALGVIAVVAISRRIDRRAAAERLRAAGTRVAESAQQLGSKVSPAVATLGEKAGELAGQVKESVSTRANDLAGQLRPSNGHGGENGNGHEPGYSVSTHTPTEEGAGENLDEARQRLSAEEPQQAAPAAAADTGAEDQPAGNDAVVEKEAGELSVSDGMKVVAFDGTDIGRVQETREDVFVLDRPRGADLLVPKDQVARIEGTVIYLRVEADRVTKMGWEKA